MYERFLIYMLCHCYIENSNTIIIALDVNAAAGRLTKGGTIYSDSVGISTFIMVYYSWS